MNEIDIKLNKAFHSVIVVTFFAFLASCNRNEPAERVTELEAGYWSIKFISTDVQEPVNMHACVNSEAAVYLHAIGISPPEGKCEIEKFKNNNVLAVTCPGKDISVQSNITLNLLDGRRFDQNVIEVVTDRGRKIKSRYAVTGVKVGECPITLKSGDVVFSDGQIVNLKYIIE